MENLLNMDETLDQPATVTLSEEQLRLARLQSLDVGDEFLFTAKAVCTALNESRDGQGLDSNHAVFELTRITLEGEEEPKPQPTRVQSFYNRSSMTGNA